MVACRLCSLQLAGTGGKTPDGIMLSVHLRRHIKAGLLRRINQELYQLYHVMATAVAGS